MRHLGYMLIGLGCALLAGCKADIPEGIFKCEADRDCPSDFVCRGAGERPGHCFARGTVDAADGGAGNDGGKRDRGERDGGVGGSGGTGAGGAAPAPVLPTTTRFSTLGELRRGNGIALYDDGFETEDRRCTADGKLCVTGGFRP